MSQADDDTDLILRPLPPRMSLDELATFVADHIRTQAAKDKIRSAADKQAQEERHSNYSRLAGHISAITNDQQDIKNEQAELRSAVAELKTALCGNHSLGVNGLVDGVRDLGDAVTGLGKVISDLSQTVRRDREDSERRHQTTDAAVRCLQVKQAETPWYKSTIATAAWCALAGSVTIAAVVKAAPLIGSILGSLS